MKTKMIIVLLVGLLIGSFLGGILIPVAKAGDYDYEIYSLLKSIASDVDTIETYIKRIYRNMP